MTANDETNSTQTPPTDHRGLSVLGIDECLRRLGAVPVGRLAFFSDGEINVLPVNHALDGMDVVFRTSWGSKLQSAADVERVSFEVDGYDQALRSGWSVLVKGNASLVYDADENRRLDTLGLRSWAPADDWPAGGGRPFWVRVHPEEVTGRAILPPAAG